MNLLQMLVFIFMGLFILSCKNVTLESVDQAARDIISGGGQAVKSVVTTEDMEKAFKQALEQGTRIGATQLSIKDAFLKNPELTIPFPPEAKKVENKLRSLGFDSVCDKFKASVNHAAENAMMSSIPIFTKAIQSLTFSDAVRLLKGKDTDITQFLRTKTEASLIAQFKPIIAAKLDEVSATKYWTQATSAYNKIPLSKPVNTDLSQFVTGQAIEGLFSRIALEEKKIRQNPAARTTELMKRVFSKQ